MKNDIENQISHLAGVLSSEGTPTDFGCTEDEMESMKERTLTIKPYKPYCIVKHWTIWDVQLYEGNQDKHEATALIKADHIIEDELKRFPVGGWVRSTLIVEIYENCIFRTNNSSYILVGKGTRKNVAIDDVTRFF